MKTITTTKSLEILNQTEKLIGKAQYAGLYGIALQSGTKNTVVDFDGNKYLDFLGGASAVTVGYGRQDVLDAYTQAAQKITHSCFVYSPNEETLQLAQKIIEITPGNFEKKVMFGTSSSDSIDGAIKAARKYTHKMGVIAFNNAYHGNTGLSAQATGFPGIRNGFLSSDDFFFVDFPYDSKTEKSCLAEAGKMFKEKQIACFIIEPIQGDGGNIVPPPGFFSSLQKLCQKYEVVLIDDETQSGAGRTGKWWAIEHFSVAPDIIVAGKGITGGYIPMSFLVGKKDIIDVLSKAQHVFTYSGHPPSCAVSYKIFSIIKQENLLQNAEQIGILLKEKLSEICQKYTGKIKWEMRGKGLQLGLLTMANDGKPLAALLGMRCLDKGLYMGYFGPDNEVLRIHPPLTLTEKEVLKAVSIIDEVLAEYVQNRIPENTYQRYQQYCLGLSNNTVIKIN